MAASKQEVALLLVRGSLSHWLTRAGLCATAKKSLWRIAVGSKANKRGPYDNNAFLGNIFLKSIRKVCFGSTNLVLLCNVMVLRPACPLLFA